MTSNIICSDKQMISKFISQIIFDWQDFSDQAGVFEIRCLGENRTTVSQIFALDAVIEATDLAVQMNANKLNVYMTINPIDQNKVTISGKAAKDVDIMRASTESLHLSYFTEEYGTVSQSVTIERIPCRFGGSRAYFRCKCNKRVVKLYAAGKHFLCRHCYHLPYSSKNESHWDRALRQRNKRRRRLSRNVGLEAYMTPKPKGMWWRTYQRLQERACEAEQRSDDEFIVMARRLVKTG